MPNVIQIGRPTKRPRSAQARRRAAHESLLAAGVAQPELVAGYDLAHGDLAEQKFYRLALAAGHGEVLSDRWPCEVDALREIPGTVFRDGNVAVVVGKDGTLAIVGLSWGWMSVRVASGSRDAAATVCSAFRQAYPAAYLRAGADDRVPITFWTYGRYGPESRLRKIDSARWDTIEGNYTAVVRDELATLMHWDEPGRDGQLILWQGSPGTGKTWALRALASEWSSWAEFHYITDPDAFFVSEPSYMVNVLLSDSYDVIERESGDVYSETDALGKWRVLILEDTGELLAANAKQSYGQGLSRLLNVVDGMIGQGLRVLALVTTNDELGTLHPAVARPGRCASQLEFGPLSAEEASAFLGETVEEGGTLAELYARQSAGADALPETVEPLESIAASGRIGDAYVRIRPNTNGFGVTPAGIEAIDRATEDLMLLASAPLDLTPDEAPAALPDTETLLASLADLPGVELDSIDTAALRAALETLQTAHRSTTEGVVSLVASAVAERGTSRGDTIGLAAIEALRQYALRPPAAPSPITVNVPEQNVKVDAPVTVHLPEQPPQPAPVVHVAAAEAPVVNVTMPEQKPAEAPHVTVNVPETKVDVHVAAPQVEVTVPTPAPRAVRVEYDDHGNKRYVAEEV